MRYKLVIFWSAIDPETYFNAPLHHFGTMYFDIERQDAIITDKQPGDTIENIAIEGQGITFSISPITDIYFVSESNIDYPALSRYYIRVAEESDPLFNVDVLLSFMATPALRYTPLNRPNTYSRVLRSFLLN
jgi:hypothetical protein